MGLDRLSREFRLLSAEALNFANNTESDSSRAHYLAAWATWGEAAKMVEEFSPAFAAAMPSGGQDINPEVELSEPRPVTIDYVNWRGELGRRRIMPTGRMVYGATEWHPRHQWLLEAMDLDKAAVRLFAFEDMQMLAPSVRDRSSEAAETSGSAEGKSPADLSATPMSPQPPSSTEGEEMQTLAELSAAASAGEWHYSPGPNFDEADIVATVNGYPAEISNFYCATGADEFEALPGKVNCSFVVALVNAYRSGVFASLRSELKAVREERDEALDLADNWKATAAAEAEIGNERAAEASHLRERVEKLEEGLRECLNQLEYEHEKFGGTGSGETVMFRTRALLIKETRNGSF